MDDLLVEESCEELLVRAFALAPTDEMGLLVLAALRGVTAYRNDAFRRRSDAILLAQKVMQEENRRVFEAVEAKAKADLDEQIGLMQANWSVSNGNGLLAEADAVAAEAKKTGAKAPAWAWATQKLAKAPSPNIVAWLKKQVAVGNVSPEDMGRVEAFYKGLTAPRGEEDI